MTISFPFPVILVILVILHSSSFLSHLFPFSLSFFSLSLHVLFLSSKTVLASVSSSTFLLDPHRRRCEVFSFLSSILLLYPVDIHIFSLLLSFNRAVPGCPLLFCFYTPHIHTQIPQREKSFLSFRSTDPSYIHETTRSATTLLLNHFHRRPSSRLNVRGQPDPGGRKKARQRRKRSITEQRHRGSGNSRPFLLDRYRSFSCSKK